MKKINQAISRIVMTRCCNGGEDDDDLGVEISEEIGGETDYSD